MKNPHTSSVASRLASSPVRPAILMAARPESGRRLRWLRQFFVAAGFLLPLATRAAYYNTYTTVATIPNSNGCYATQGFDTGSTYAYSAKISGLQPSKTGTPLGNYGFAQVAFV